MNFKKLTLGQKQVYLTKIESTLVSKKLFLKSDLSLPDLAQETGIQLHTLSHLINSQTSQNFRDYINLMRIGYFKEKINDTRWKDLTVEQMVTACGFNSRAAAHRAFIKHVGATPSEYLKLHRVHPAAIVPKKRYNFG
ncbi:MULTISPECIES: helix-turn-helix domain-containing protein [Flavobacterium]|uniref:helix-turn-helix domain-containing protein n=1 Tax=Flavobacterium TaxID=237 RepID=UPI00211488C9|nr:MULTISPECIES: AraC family transcriptional regulator [Flavobacterium]UUF12554.1 AraC family transcriptional regulator [Flavobacterium panici]